MKKTKSFQLNFKNVPKKRGTVFSFSLSKVLKIKSSDELDEEKNEEVKKEKKKKISSL